MRCGLSLSTRTRDRRIARSAGVRPLLENDFDLPVGFEMPLDIEHSSSHEGSTPPASAAIPALLALAFEQDRHDEKSDPSENERHWAGLGRPDSQAAAVKHRVIRIENAIGIVKRYLQLTTV